MIDTTKPSRELDVAVARAMGLKIAYGVVGRTKTRDYFWYDSEMVERPLPHFSQPKETMDKTAVLDMILWLQTRGVVITDRRDGSTMVELRPTPTDAEVQTVCITRIADGDPLQALALALCQVVVSAGGLEE